MTESSEAAACAGIIEDIVALIRRFAANEPYKSASGPEALLALATHLDELVAATRTARPAVVSVAVRSRRKRSDR
jgi:hypothetical protein